MTNFANLLLFFYSRCYFGHRESPGRVQGRSLREYGRTQNAISTGKLGITKLIFIPLYCVSCDVQMCSSVD